MRFVNLLQIRAFETLHTDQTNLNGFISTKPIYIHFKSMGKEIKGFKKYDLELGHILIQDLLKTLKHSQ